MIHVKHMTIFTHIDIYIYIYIYIGMRVYVRAGQSHICISSL